MNESRMPYVIEKSGRSEKHYDIYSKLLENRTIVINGVIEADMSMDICAQLMYLEQQEVKDIKVYINSPGGSVTAGLAIYDVFNIIKSKVITIAMGEVCSMGSFLLSMGDERYSLPNTSIMYHSVSSGFTGTVHDHEISFKETKRLQNELLKKLVDSTKGKCTLKKLQKKLSRDYWITPSKALKLNLIDGIMKE